MKLAIVSGWCDQVGFQTVFEDVKAAYSVTMNIFRKNLFSF